MARMTPEQVRERERQALVLRKAGLNFEEIGQRLGISQTMAHRIVHRGRDRLVREPAQELIDLEVARYDDLHRAIWPTALRGNVHAIDRALAISKRRADLLGLDAPARHDISAKLAAEVYSTDALDRELERVRNELAEHDPEWGEQDRRQDARQRAAEQFRREWSTPGQVTRDPAGFVAAALELGIDLLDLDDTQREAAGLEVERLLWTQQAAR